MSTPSDGLARGLGWFSLALGAPQVLAPGVVNRAVGVCDTDRARALMRTVGLRELATGAGILSRPRPAGWLWARVAGDVKDLALLGVAFRSPGSRTRLALTTACVLSTTVLDVIVSVRLSRAPV